MRLIIPGADFSVNAIDTEKIYTLYQGYASAGATPTTLTVNGDNTTRVRTSELAGSYTIKTKSGYVIRAIVTYSPALGDVSEAGTYSVTDRLAVSDVQGLAEYTLNNPGKYSIITFCKTDSTDTISPTEDIVAELY